MRDSVGQLGWLGSSSALEVSTGSLAEAATSKLASLSRLAVGAGQRQGTWALFYMVSQPLRLLFSWSLV